MKRVVYLLWHEPAVLFQAPAIVFATAAGVWDLPALAFGAAASSALGAYFTRQRVTPLEPGKE